MRGVARNRDPLAGPLGPEALNDAAQAGKQVAEALRPWQAGIEVVGAVAD